MCVLHDENEVCRESAKETVVGDGESRDQLGELRDALLCIDKVYTILEFRHSPIVGIHGNSPITDKKRRCRSRVRILAGSSRKKLFSRPAMA